jgi:aspartyl/glutamyl-tRNA(Asn/Gln) amidotransferase C subunit
MKMKKNIFPIEQVAKLAKLNINSDDTQVQQDFAEIIQIIDIVNNYQHNEDTTDTQPNTESFARDDIVSSLNRRGRNIQLASESVGMQYYSVPLVIDEQ